MEFSKENDPKTSNEKKKKDTLLWWSAKGVLHLSPKCDELNHPMVLPVARISLDVHILLCVVQFDNFHLPGALRFLAELERSMTDSLGPLLGDPSMRSVVVEGKPWRGAPNPN